MPTSAPRRVTQADAICPEVASMAVARGSDAWGLAADLGSEGIGGAHGRFDRRCEVDRMLERVRAMFGSTCVCDGGSVTVGSRHLWPWLSSRFAVKNVYRQE